MIIDSSMKRKLRRPGTPTRRRPLLSPALEGLLLLVGALCGGTVRGGEPLPPSLPEEAAAIVRGVLQQPLAPARVESLAAAGAKVADPETRGTLTVLYALGARSVGEMRRAEAAESRLRREQPTHPYLRYLSPVFTFGLCLDCEGYGKRRILCPACARVGVCSECQSAGWVWTRCVACGATGRVPSLPQVQATYVAVLRLAAGLPGARPPAPERSLTDPLAELQQRLASWTDEVPPEEQRARLHEIAAFLQSWCQSSRIAVRARIEACAADPSGTLKMRIGPLSLLDDWPELAAGRLAVLPARTLLVRGAPGVRPEDLVGQWVLVEGRPAFREGLRDAGSAHDRVWRLLLLRLRGSSTVIGEFVLPAFTARVGPHLFVTLR